MNYGDILLVLGACVDLKKNSPGTKQKGLIPPSAISMVLKEKEESKRYWLLCIGLSSMFASGPQWLWLLPFQQIISQRVVQKQSQRMAIKQWGD